MYSASGALRQTGKLQLTSTMLCMLIRVVHCRFFCFLSTAPIVFVL